MGPPEFQERRGGPTVQWLRNDCILRGQSLPPEAVDTARLRIAIFLNSLVDRHHPELHTSKLTAKHD